MYRVLLPLAITLVVAGCSLNSSSLTANLNSDATTTGSTSRASRQGALGGEPTVRASTATTASQGVASTTSANQKVAKLDDRAPKGSFEKAPVGALADRDYGSTKLDPEAARDLINAYRKQHGLKPLKLNAELSNAAKNHSRDLAKWDRISHFGSDGSNPWDRVKRTGYNPKVAAENVGTGQATIEEVMKGWKESPGHNKNLLLADAEHMGIALVQESKTEFKTFWTLVLGSPL